MTPEHSVTGIVTKFVAVYQHQDHAEISLSLCSPEQISCQTRQKLQMKRISLYSWSFSQCQMGLRFTWRMSAFWGPPTHHIVLPSRLSHMNMGAGKHCPLGKQMCTCCGCSSVLSSNWRISIYLVGFMAMLKKMLEVVTTFVIGIGLLFRKALSKLCKSCSYDRNLRHFSLWWFVLSWLLRCLKSGLHPTETMPDSLHFRKGFSLSVDPLMLIEMWLQSEALSHIHYTDAAFRAGIAFRMLFDVGTLADAFHTDHIYRFSSAVWVL